MAKLENILQGEFLGKRNGSVRLVITAVTGIIFGLLIGASLPANTIQIQFPSSIFSYNEDRNSSLKTPVLLNDTSAKDHNTNTTKLGLNYTLEKYAPTNPKGAETLPPGIVVSESDLYQHRLWGHPSEVQILQFSLFV
ncbi:uncharacterized protein LOC109723361 [Ananas comosus]|uniref:Uncharacterized protein LOC109723361 n=1 Tax=Ananas comosus TaxID=4615 RepID=A0A6P5GHK3_ANACO|nr:uncharacterized protein LOC109723361 [Ananas comosus]